ncbi:MAG TPA: hypothetical protein VFR17_05205 [Mycobacterium sp.]|nr:hypothetical protein [Mycobacterium sp.]
MYVKPMYRYRVGRIAWLLFRRPAKSGVFAAEHERLITAEELSLLAT